MSVFCLVHGSTQNASGWDLLVAELTRLGHSTICPSLPKDTPDAGAAAYARVIADSLPKGVNEAVVIAHSASGNFLPLVPELRPVARIVFLGSMIPQIGMSAFGQIQSDASMLNPAWMGKNPVMYESDAREFLFHDCSEEAIQWALTTRSLLFAKGALMEVTPLKKWPQVPMSYIVCTEDRTIQPDWSRRAARERLHVEAIEIPGGHCPYVSRPTVLAQVLSSMASLH